MILLWGTPGDDPLDCVRVALDRRGADAWLLDQRDAYGVSLAADGSAGTVTAAGGAVELTELGAAYIRPQESHAERVAADAALVAWADLAPVSVVNRPAAMASNTSKPYQLRLLAGYGFDVPDTLVTTDPAEADEFRRRHGRVVYKSVSGVRSIVAQLREEQLERLADVANGPTQFQEWVRGDDVRAHVVGDEVISTLLRSSADDYRYASRDGVGVEVAETTLPEQIAERCRTAALGMGLHVCGFDLRRTPDGRWVCFEVNPSPAFSFYEAATGQPIADAVARLLMRVDAQATRRGTARSRSSRPRRSVLQAPS
jgi:glutathione synthase/RimK-type ligase-like ATP-grasp enzyme